MRHVTTALDVVGACAVVAGVLLVAGLGVALMVAGAAVLATSWRLSR